MVKLSHYLQDETIITVKDVGNKKSSNPKIFFFFSIENFIANISLYALSWSKLNFGCYLTFEIIF